MEFCVRDNCVSFHRTFDSLESFQEMILATGEIMVHAPDL